MRSVKEILIDLFKRGTPEDPADIHWQNLLFREIFTQLYPEVAEEATNPDSEIVEKEERA